MMRYSLTLPAILRRAESHFAHKEIVSRGIGGSDHRYTYADLGRRARQLAGALQRLGVAPGDRVATLCWNHYRHLEAYFGVPALGAVLHTLNLRLHPDELAYIVGHAGDKIILVDESAIPLFEKFRERVACAHVIVVRPEPGGVRGFPETGTGSPMSGAPRSVGTSDGVPVPVSGDRGRPPAPDSHDWLDYESLLAQADQPDSRETDLDEDWAAALCYTSGTTGRPKGVLYSHRALAIHSLVVGLASTLGVRESDVVMPVVPMFHANAWGLPYAAALVGAKLVFPSRQVDPPEILAAIEQERVTLAAGVSTIWLGLLRHLDKEPGRADLSSLRLVVAGGAPAPESMIRGFEERHGIPVVHSWGMTELAPVGTIGGLPSDLMDASKEDQYRCRAKQGQPVPFLETRVRQADGTLAPWDGHTTGELEVRGPCVASAYFESPDSSETFTSDGWFRTGDVASIDSRGYVEIHDRKKDLIKSGGEWISSVALENALMAHRAVAEAAVIAVPHPKWQERPLAVVVLEAGQSASPADLRAHLKDRFPSWWIPEAFEFVDRIPRTSAGKFDKLTLRARFVDRYGATGGTGGTP